MKVTFDKFSPVDPKQNVTSRQIFVTATDPSGTITYLPPLEAISGTAECELPDGSTAAADMCDVNKTGQTSTPSQVVQIVQAPQAAPSRPTILHWTVS